MTKKLALIGAPLVGLLVFYLLQEAWGFSASLMAGVMCSVIILWFFEVFAVWVPPVLGLLAAIFFKIDSASSLLGAFYHKAVLLLLGSFVLARALEYHQLSHWLAQKFSKRMGQTPFGFIFLITAITFFFSMWISNSAATAMMLPLVLAGFKSMSSSSEKRFDNFKAKSVLFVAFAASLGGLGTPVGSPTNLLGLGMMAELGLKGLDFFSWMVIGCSIAGVCYGLMMWFLKFVYRDMTICFDGPKIHRSENEPKGASVLFVGICVVFIMTIFCWVFPGLLSFFLSNESSFSEYLNYYLSESNVALGSAVLILFLPLHLTGNQKTLLPLRELRYISWGTLVLFGASIALGGLLMKSGLIDHLAAWISQWSFVSSEIAILFLCISLAVFLSDMMSNTATVNIIVPLAYALAEAKGISPRLPVLGAVLASSYGFMLPVSTPPNALAYATGLIGLRQMMRYGILMDILGIVVIGCVLILFRGWLIN